MVSKYNSKSVRKIRTARTEAEINKGARKGFFPLVKKVIPSKEIRSKFAVFQDQETGTISVLEDYRGLYDGSKVQVIGFTFYYPYNFPAPFAAYLIPADIEINETVYIEDLIEDLVGERWNQGDAYRLKSCIARWTGKDFDILHDEPKSPTFIG